MSGALSFARSSRSKKAPDRDVFIEIGPMNALPAPDEPPMLPLPFCGLREARKPDKRGGQLASIRKSDHEPLIRYGHIDGGRIQLNGQNGHSTPPRKSGDARSPSLSVDAIHALEN